MLRDESRFCFYRYCFFLVFQKASPLSRHLSCLTVASLHELLAMVPVHLPH